MTPPAAKIPKDAVHNVVPELHHHLVPIDQVQPHPDNARVGDVEFVRQSLREHGQYRVLVADEDDLIAVGNHTWRAAKAEGWTHVAAIRRPIDAAAARRLRVTDNRSHDRGRYDERKLLAELDELVAHHADQTPDDPDARQLALAGVGYAPAELADLRKIAEGKPAADPPAAFADPEQSMTVEYRCPGCGYEWSGNPTGGTAGQPALPDPAEEG